MRYDYDYNEEGLLTAKYQSRDAAPRPVLRYEYDVEGRTVARTDAGGTRVEYAHDPLGRVVAIRQGENELARYTYAAGNRIASMLYGNGVQTAYEYTPEGQVSRLHTRAADGTVLLDNRYAYDRSGNTIGCYGTQDQAEYRYDALDRLVEARYAGYGTEQLAYDAAGNRISRIWNGQRTSYTYDTRNRLLSLIEEALQEENEEQGRANERTSGKNIRYAYDAQGNLIQEHQGEQTTSYVYDGFNRTIRVEQADGRIVQHGYDPEGLRSRLDTDGTVRHFVHDGWHVVNELDETERVQASYIRGHEWLTQLDDQGEVAYYVNNIHGDVTHLTGSQGQILNAYTYDAFGNMLSSREQRVNTFRYAGEMQDALTGHYYLRARFYNPIIARFTQEDTYRGDGLNLYAYVANNPIRYVDPSGYAKAGKSGGTPASCVNKGDKYDTGALVYQEYDIVPYDNRTYKTPGYEKHYGVLNEWAEHNIAGYTKKNAPTILLTPKTHEATKEVYREWLRENYGKPVGVSPDWSNMSKTDAMKLTHDMFEAAKVPQGIRDEYFELFDIFITGG